jgi:biotin operon repressor
MIHIHFANHTHIHVRFAFSPLLETTLSYHRLQYPRQDAVYAQWLDETRQALHGMEFAFMDALILPRYYMADFLTPTPTAPRTDFEAELQSVLATPPDVVRESVRQAIEFDGTSEIREYFLAYPSEALYCLVEEMRAYWQRTLSLYWSRLLPVLENDVLYRARVLAIEGTESVLHSLDKRVLYAPGVLTLDKHYKGSGACDDYVAQTTNNLLYLIPSAFSFNSLSWQITEPWHPALYYGTRGTGLWHSAPPPNNAALEITLGEARARIFMALSDPTSTSELARKLHLTDGAVSQHLTLLRQAGLIESQRSGYRVYHRLSQRGTQLMALFG